MWLYCAAYRQQKAFALVPVKAIDAATTNRPYLYLLDLAKPKFNVIGDHTFQRVASGKGGRVCLADTRYRGRTANPKMGLDTRDVRRYDPSDCRWKRDDATTANRVMVGNGDSK